MAETTITFEWQGATKKKYQEFIELVKKMILEGQIRPGDKLPTEAQLSEQLGMSRTPVREAIKILESVGVISIKRGEGMYLQRPVSGSDANPLVFDLLMLSHKVDSLIEFRQYFEQMIIDMALRNHDPTDCDGLKQYLSDQIQATNNTDDATWADLDIGFHVKILEMTKNPFMIDIGRTVYELYRNLKPYVRGPQNRQNTLKTHRLYLEIVCGEKPELIEQLRAQIEENFAELRMRYSTFGE